ncbi:MAG: hypothetical protein O2856_18965 [Planctomycetota bacterium]|nr:hypothetical protein [Planctomycetota bacterium]
MNDLTGRQIARNRETQNQPSFASHREQVMRLIANAVSSIQQQEHLTITIAGAGNCQDVDLKKLAGLFSEIRLIDIDADAVRVAVSRHSHDVAARVQVFAPIDIAAPLMTGISLVQHQSEMSSEFLNAVESAIVPHELPTSDIVVSACLLSQLIDSASQIVPPDAPGFLSCIQAVRRGHLVRLLELTSVGGRTLLITDLVSADTVPNVATVSPEDLPQLMFQCLQTGNFFSGLSPAVMQHDLQNIPACVTRCASFQILPPWKWDLGSRSFAVYAVEMVRGR